MTSIKDAYCRLIKFLFLRSHSMQVSVRRNGNRFSAPILSSKPAVINDGIELIEIAMIPNHRAAGSWERIR